MKIGTIRKIKGIVYLSAPLWMIVAIIFLIDGWVVALQTFGAMVAIIAVMLSMFKGLGYLMGDY